MSLEEKRRISYKNLIQETLQDYILNKSIIFEFYIKGHKTYNSLKHKLFKHETIPDVVFFSIVLTIYSLVNIYLYYKGYSALPVLQKNKTPLRDHLFLCSAAIFIVAKFLESRHSSVITDALNIIGGFWLAFMLYGFLFFLLSDIILLIFKNNRHGITKENILLYRKWSFIIIVSIIHLF